MPDIATEVSYIADLDLYKHEKPYFIFWGASQEERPLAKSNLAFNTHKNIQIHDIRRNKELFSVEKNGFEILDHVSEIPLPLKQAEDIAKYKEETQALLKKRFNAIGVYCYDARIRENTPASDQVLDLRNPMSIERPAKSPHTDATKDSGPSMIENHLPEHMKSLRTTGTRVRIVNTWRSMLPVIDDCPLAFMDYSTVSKHDLIAADRVLPHIVGEIYYVKHNPKQKWYWLDGMTSQEPAVFLTYDSNPPAGAAKHCPHVAVLDPRTGKEAHFRQSIETRSIVITEA